MLNRDPKQRPNIN
jgi:NIMA (never in mitosis gene a)-related kinase